MSRTFDVCGSTVTLDYKALLELVQHANERFANDIIELTQEIRFGPASPLNISRLERLTHQIGLAHSALHALEYMETRPDVAWVNRVEVEA